MVIGVDVSVDRIIDLKFALLHARARRNEEDITRLKYLSTFSVTCLRVQIIDIAATITRTIDVRV